MHRHHISQCLQLIKRKLKEKSLTYVDVANVLSVSENTVKRLLNSRDISFERLLTLAELCGLSINDLANQAKEKPTPFNYFSIAQDKAFFENPNLWQFFCELFYSSKAPIEIQRENALSALSIYRYLRALDKLQLIELQPNNKVTFLVSTPIGFRADSLVLRANIAKHIKSTCDAVISEQCSEQHFMWVKPMKMPLSLFAQMNEELVTVINKYSEVAEIAFANDDSLPNMQTTLVGHPLTFNENSQVEINDIGDLDLQI